jgi:apolipoprotein N-acyltransferase
MQNVISKLGAWKLWAAAGLSAGLLELLFPLAGPLPIWRSIFAWFALVPLLWALLSPACVDAAASLAPRLSARLSLRRALVRRQLLLGPRRTMKQYGDMPPMAPTLLLLAFSLVWGFTLAFFGWALFWCAGPRAARASRSSPRPSCGSRWSWPPRASPVSLGSAGYSQVDNALLISLRPGPAFMGSASCWW